MAEPIQSSILSGEVSTEFHQLDADDVADEQTRLQSNVLIPADRREYIGGFYIWGAGLKEDPVAGSKRGKGVPYLNSSFWVEDLSVFIAKHLHLLRQHMLHVNGASTEYQYKYFLNQSNVVFMKALKSGLKTELSKEQLLMASWLVMAAAEVDDFDFKRYSSESRVLLKQKFFAEYLAEEPQPALNAPPPPSDPIFTGSTARVDLLPKVALERLGIHNELCQVKYGDNADLWMKEGFKVSKRIDSTKRHLDEAHKLERAEDAIAHAIWNFMAIYHVLSLFPSMNDLTNFEALAEGPTA